MNKPNHILSNKLKMRWASHYTTKKNNIQSEIDKAHKNIQQAILQH